jgi:tetratricopeptide (TPR) repeat protein
MKHAILTLLLLVVLTSAYSQTKSTKEISGTITYLNEPLKDVNITVKNTSKGTKTNDNGNYSLQANIGDQIQYSYVGFETVTITIEDVTSVLNIEMDNYVTKLDEVIVEGTSKTKKSSPGDEYNRKINTSHGNINPMLLPDSRYFSRDRIATQYRTLSDALKFYYPKGIDFFTEFEVDGKIFDFEPHVKMSTIRDIYVATIRSAKYPSPIQIMIIRTTNSEEYREITAEKHRNQNYYDDDAIVSDETETFSSNNLIKTISGKVTHLFAPIPNVNITIKGTSKGTKTNDQGYYSLQANVGDILKYSHVSYTTVAVMIEDVTSTLNIELQEKDNQLDEVLVKARVDQKALDYLHQRTRIIKTGVGEINLKAIGFAIDYSAGKDLPRHCDGVGGDVRPLECAAAQKFPFLTRLAGTDKPPIWDVDGMIMERPPFIPVGSIEHMWFLSNAPASYGHKKVIIVQTISGTLNIEQEKEEIAEQYKNQNYYNADAVTTSDETTFSSANIKTSQPKYIVTKDIHGKVSYLYAPMPLVNISIVGKNSGIVTSPKGTYSIEANVGDIIQYSHVGFATVSIIVEDVTEVLNIEMVEKQNELETVIVTADGKLGKTAELARKADKTFKTAMGTYDPKTSGNSSAYIDGNDVTSGARDILDVLNGKVAGVTVDRVNMVVKLRSTGSINTDVPAIFDVDGVIVNGIPQIDPANIKDIHLLKSLASTTRYGTAGRGGVIVVTTRSGDFSATEANRNKIADKYTNKDFYANDASQISLSSLNANSYADALEAFPNKQKAFIYYDEKLKNQLPSYADHIAIAQKFVSHFNDLTLSTQIFKELIERNSKNPEVLKAIAFHLQTIGRPKEAIEAYERTFKLRPQYAQSYRDLANAYIDNDQYKKSWRLYMSYLMQGNDVSTEGIGELIYNEMEWLYFSRRNQTEIKEKFVPKSENLFDFRNDVRIVVEWNSSEAEFDLEFVNPELRSYIFEHTLAGNQELITDEKEKGYSSKEFFIDDLKDGEWLVNISYKGNKKPEPTYFKITKFYNWGKATETKVVSVYKFQNEREKIQLMQFNKELLVASK